MNRKMLCRDAALLCTLLATAMSDPAQIGGGAYTPARPLAAWPRTIANQDLLPASREAREWGRVGLLFDIAADGAITHCRVARGSGYPGIDAASCPWLVAHARFSPARAGGQAVVSHAFEQIDWGSPPVLPMPPSSAIRRVGTPDVAARVRVPSLRQWLRQRHPRLRRPRAPTAPRSCGVIASIW